MKKLFTLLMLMMLLWAGGLWASVTVTIGTGTAITSGSTSSITPYKTYWMDGQDQILYTAAELIAAGLGPGNIEKIAFNVGTADSYPMNAFTISVQQIAGTSLTGFLTSGWTVCYTATVVATTGWNTHTFTTPFNWDGTSSLVFKVCFDDDDYNNNSHVYYTTTPSSGVHYYEYGDYSLASGCDVTNTDGNAARPNIQITGQPGASPLLTAVPPSLGFGYSPSGTPTASQTYVLSGTNLTAGPIVVTAPTGFQVSSNGTSWVSTFNVTYTPPNLANTTIYARFNPSGPDADYSGNITNVGGGSSANVAVTGSSNYIFCDAGSDFCDEFISLVQVGTIDNSSSCDDGNLAYADYSSISTNMYKTIGYPISVTNGPPAYTSDQCGIWVDWNNDTDFNDANETITVSGGVAVFTGTITPPVSAFEGSVRMRIRIMWTGTLDPCGYTDYGEVEDYTINVLPAPTDPVFNITPAGYDYGDCPLNNFSPENFTQTFTVQNIGPGTLNISSVGLTGGDNTVFELTDGNSYPVGLSGSSTIQFTVFFNPVTVGPKATTLRIHTTSPDTDHDLPLTGNALVYPPQNLSGQTTISYTNELDWDPPLPEGEIRYDYGFATNYYYITPPSSINHYFCTRITPPEDGNLDYIAVFSRANAAATWNQILVCPENGITDTPDLTAPIATFSNIPVTSLTGEWIILQLPPSTPITAGTDYFILTRWPDLSSIGPLVGTDESTDFGRCSYSTDGGTIWNPIPYAFLMRGYMSTVAMGATYSIASGTPNPSLANLPVKALSGGRQPFSRTTEKAARIPVPGVYKEEAGRELLSYNVLRGPDAASLALLEADILTTDYIDDPVDPSTTYFYGVTAVYSGNQQSDTSNIISLTTLALCPSPTAPTTTALTQIGANFGWTDPSGTVWDLYIVAAGSPAPDALSAPTIDDIGANPYTWTSGTPETSYDWYVRTDCGPTESDVSEWTSVSTFTTTQIPAALPFIENFETWPNDWEVVNGTETNQWYVGTAIAHTGTQSAYISQDGGVTHTFNIDVASVVHFYRDVAFSGGLGGYTLKFWWLGQGESCCDYLKVFVVDPSTIPVAGIQLVTGQVGVNYNIQGAWTEVTLTLPGSYTGLTKRLVFSWRNDNSVGIQPPAAVDDINIFALACPEPTTLSAVASFTSADISWAAGYDETAWEYYNSISGGPDPVVGIPTTDNPTSLTGLDENTDYEFWVRAFCDPEYSEWVGPYPFTTLESCPAPSAGLATSITTNSADLGWTSNASGTTWDVELGLAGFTVDNGESFLNWSETEDNPVNAGGLTHSETYDFYVREICGFVNPKIDHFYLAQNSEGTLDPGLSGGYTQVLNPGETLEWEYYDQVTPSWYNIWFYNDPLDINKMKKIRMGFWIQKLDPLLPATYDYVVNWSTEDWPMGIGYPTPADEAFIERSPENGQIEITGGAEWVEMYYTIPDYNPEWISVDIFGSNIQILNEEIAPELTSPLYSWWNLNPQRGGIIVHECLPKPSGNVSDWSGPFTFTTDCEESTLPYCESFDPPMSSLPNCWTEQLEGLITSPHWSVEASNLAGGTANEAMAGWSPNQGTTQADNDRMVSPALNTSGMTSINLSFKQYFDDYNAGINDVWVKVQTSSDGLTWTDEWVYPAGLGVDILMENKNMVITNNVGSTTYIAWTLSGKTFNINSWHIDDICIYESCAFNTWTGAVSTAWNNPANWSCGILPNNQTTVQIPAGLTFYPIVPAGITAYCYQVELSTGATLVVEATGVLIVTTP